MVVKVFKMVVVIIVIVMVKVACFDLADVSLDLCIYTTNKYPNVKQLSSAIN